MSSQTTSEPFPTLPTLSVAVEVFVMPAKSVSDSGDVGALALNTCTWPLTTKRESTPGLLVTVTV